MGHSSRRRRQNKKKKKTKTKKKNSFFLFCCSSVKKCVKKVLHLQLLASLLIEAKNTRRPSNSDSLGCGLKPDHSVLSCVFPPLLCEHRTKKKSPPVRCAVCRSQDAAFIRSTIRTVMKTRSLATFKQKKKTNTQHDDAFFISSLLRIAEKIPAVDFKQQQQRPYH